MNELLVRNESIQRLFNWYRNELFLVNRKYQRKLVWTLEEKQEFINSIALGYPVPLFLLAESNGKYEIIDGMQRLEAIFSFLQGKYPIKYNNEEGYFDLETMAETKVLADSKELKQETPILPREVCVSIVNYPIALSITPFKGEQVEDIFRRINATGRQLSNQDLRQAGASGSFCDLVRKISNQIRRDSSVDILPLSKMREISLSSRTLDYGIDLNQVFWVKNQIITVSNMRLSRDEELISYLLIYILLGPDISPTAKNLDIIYGFEEEDNNALRSKMRTAIERDGESNIINRFMFVFDELERILNCTPYSFSKLIFENEARGKGRSFQVVFLALYNLMTNGKILSNKTGLIKTLTGIGNRELTEISSDKWKASYRQEKVLAIQGIIERFFINSERFDPAIDNWISKLENILTQSKIEQQLFDFKIGLHDLRTKAFNSSCLSNIVKTLTAMANTHKGAKGYVLIGIADSINDANEFESVYGTKSITFNSFFITGVDSEADNFYKSKDMYFNRIKQKIEAEPIDESTKSYITRHMSLVNYYDKSIVVLYLSSEDKPILYNGKYYERRAANNSKIDIELEASDMSDLFSRFA